MHSHVNPLFLGVYRFPKPTSESRGMVPKKPVPHTTAAINRTNLATQVMADVAWVISAPPPQGITTSSPSRYHRKTQYCLSLFFSQRARIKPVIELGPSLLPRRPRYISLKCYRQAQAYPTPTSPHAIYIARYQYLSHTSSPPTLAYPT
jgi:hypothetical protein